jgi:hypothetical protein
MQIIKVEQDSEEWLELRKGKITGSGLIDVLPKRSGSGKKVGFYQLIADKLAIDDGETSSRDRGHDLEREAIQHFEDVSGKKVDEKCGMWVSDDHPDIAISPDGGILNKKKEYTEAVEVKCFGSALHIEAIIENKVPAKYWPQSVQYFIVNEKLQRLYFIFYDPRVISKPIHVIELTREEVQKYVDEYKEFELKTLQEVNEWVEKLAF